MTTKQNWEELLELANQYPSPHNGQPIRLKIINDNQIDLFFEKERGLQAVDISLIFSFVSMGVFTEHLKMCAEALGHDISYHLALPREKELKGEGLIKFATGSINWNSRSEDKVMKQALQFRQTSRKKYFAGIDNNLAQKAIDLAQSSNMNLQGLDEHAARQAIWLNQRAVFDDMFDDATRHELDHWLRYSPQQKQSQKDGLAYDCMELNGRAMKFIVHHHRILRWPLISQILKQYYLRTMTDKSNVFYMLAPFATENDAYNVGVVIMKIWFEIAKDKSYLHPFGTIMSNHQAHQDFLNLVGVQNETREKSYLVFIFRAGKSETPVRSLRIPYDKHLLLT